MTPDIAVQFKDMIEAVRRALAYTRGMDRARLFADGKTVDAVVRNLEVLGRAAKNLPDTLRSSHREIEWERITGLGDLLARARFAIDPDIFWDLIARRLPMLLPLLEECLAPEARV